MRRIQISARVGGECAFDSALGKNFIWPTSEKNGATPIVGKIVVNVCWSEFDLDNGCEAGPVR